MTFTLPIDRATETEKERGTQVFRPSSRILAMVTGSSKSIGASCNTFHCKDSLESIGASMAWTYSVLGYQGAPAVYFDLRPEGAPLSTGGSSSGLVEFAKDFDRVISHMRRAEKKNGAGIAYVDWSHKDLDKFADAEFVAAYKAVYLPANGTEEMAALLKNTKMLNKLAKDYNNFKYFLVKRPKPTESGEELFCNLCTEVEIPHQGTCVLGAVNLSLFGSLEELIACLPLVMVDAVRHMNEYKESAQRVMRQSSLWCYSSANNQFGLGLYGLASFLAQAQITYAELAEVFEFVAGFEGDVAETSRWLKAQANQTKATKLVQALYESYSLATYFCQGKVRAAFCFQPTVSTSADSFSASGHVASPELQPVIGLQHDDAVSTLLKSARKGDRVIDYHPATETIFSVPYPVYLSVARGFQRLIDSTGLAHRHSLCYYGDKFTKADLVSFLKGNERSLYYRLSPNQNAESLKKDELWQETGDIVDADFDLETIGRQQFGTIECDCTM